MRIDEYGRAIVKAEEIFELILQEKYTDDLYIEPDAAAVQYNKECLLNDKRDFMIDPPEHLGSAQAYHSQRAGDWNVPEPFSSIDVREYLYSLCESEEQINRVIVEMELYEEREMVPVLRLLLYLVDHFRKNKVVWGVGRGSSVASYVLYLIGINKIDPLKFGLEISDFLRAD